MRYPLLVAAILLAAPRPAAAQTITFDMGRLLSDPDWSTYRLGFARSLTGPIGYVLYGLHAGEMNQEPQKRSSSPLATPPVRPAAR